ncbi:MAG: hypothetical protein ACO3A2_11655 [Bdellovibrionia bacterium]
MQFFLAVLLFFSLPSYAVLVTDTLGPLNSDSIFFRGDNRDPEVIFQEGFLIHQKKQTHAKDQPFFSGSATVSMSKKSFAAAGFPLQRAGEVSDVSYLYLIDGDEIRARDLGYEDFFESSLSSSVQDPIDFPMILASSWPEEVITRKPIPPSAVMGSLKLKRSVQAGTMPMTYNRFELIEYFENPQAQRKLSRSDLGFIHLNDGESFYNPIIPDKLKVKVSILLFFSFFQQIKDDPQNGDRSIQDMLKNALEKTHQAILKLIFREEA